MGVRILHDRQDDLAALYCSTSGVAFGPLFNDDTEHDHDPVERAESFLRFLDHAPDWASYEKVGFMGRNHDPRELTDAGLQRAYGDWLGQEAAQWKAEDDAERERLGLLDDIA